MKAGGENLSGGKRGVREGCRGGVKTHLFLDGCEFRMKWRVAWEHNIVVRIQKNPGREAAAIRELNEGFSFKIYHCSVY